MLLLIRFNSAQKNKNKLILSAALILCSCSTVNLTRDNGNQVENPALFESAVDWEDKKRPIPFFGGYYTTKYLASIAKIDNDIIKHNLIAPKGYLKIIISPGIHEIEIVCSRICAEKVVMTKMVQLNAVPNTQYKAVCKEKYVGKASKIDSSEYYSNNYRYSAWIENIVTKEVVAGSKDEYFERQNKPKSCPGGWPIIII